jgi:hypothetical protein
MCFGLCERLRLELAGFGFDYIGLNGLFFTPFGGRMFKWLFVVLISICSLMSASPDLKSYLLYAKAIDDESHSITLSNGWVCNAINAFWWDRKKIAVGDQVFLDIMFWGSDEKESIKEYGQFVLWPGFFPFWISEDSKSFDITYVATTYEWVTPGGWFTSPVYKKCIELSDGSKWEESEWGGEKAKKFHEGDRFYPGDRIVVSYHSNHLNHWKLINIDRFTNFPDVKASCYQCVYVTPFSTIGQ